MVDGTEQTLASAVAIPTTVNTRGYTITLSGKSRVTTTQSLPSTGSDDTWTIGVAQFANNTSSAGTITIAAVQCPFKLTVHHAPTNSTDTARQLRIAFGGSQVYLGGGGVSTASGVPGYSVTLDSTTTTSTCTSGTIDVVMDGYNGTNGAGVRVYDLWIEQ